MRKWVLRTLYALPVLLIGGYAMSDYTATQGTVAAFVCQSTKICPGVVLYDPTGANGAAVKAASTAAAATDPAVVVAVSPNNTIPISAASLPLPTSAATAALQTTGNTSLTTINATLGTPMQATGGSVTANAGTNLNTSALATSANQTNATQKTQVVDGSGNVIASTSNALNVQCANCSGSGVSAADAATFTAGTSLFAPVGGQFTSGGATACVTGHECTAGMTAARAIFGDTSSIAGTATLTGNGPGGAGAQRVTIASDNTAFTVVATQATGTNLHMVCDSGCSGSGGTSIADAGTFTAGTTAGTPLIAEFTSGGATACVTGHACWVGMTAARGMFTDLSSQAGTAITSAPSAYGTVPTGNVIGVNAFVTNTNLNGQTTMLNSSPVVIASNQSTLPTGLVSQYPTGATPLTASATGTTAATTATLAGAVGKTTFVCGYSIRANASAAATGNATVTGTITGTLNFTQWTAPNASGIGINEQIFTPCVPASTTNTGIAVVSAAPGTGGVVSSTAWGYQL